MSDDILESQDSPNELDNPKTCATVEKSLSTEVKELVSAKYALSAELFDILSDEEIHLSLKKEVSLRYNMGYHDDTLVYDDPDFDIDAEILGNNGERGPIREAASKYTRHDLLEPATKKVIRIDQTVFNSAYFFFNPSRASRLEELKTAALARIGEFQDRCKTSAFDVDVNEFAKKEDIKMSFDGYIFTFARFVNIKIRRNELS
jgi:hypothetical protein